MMMGGGPRGMIGNYHDVVGKVYDPRVASRLVQYLRPYRRELTIALVAMICAAAANLAAPYLLKLAIDDFIARSDIAGLTRISLLTVGVYFVGFVSTWQQTWQTSLVGQYILATLRDQVFCHLQRLSMRTSTRTSLASRCRASSTTSA